MDRDRPWMICGIHDPYPVVCALMRLRAKGGSYEGSIQDQVLIQDYAEWAVARIGNIDREHAETLAQREAYLQAANGNGHARGFGSIQEQEEGQWPTQ